MQVSPFRRGKNLTCIYTDERPDLCRELPNWMFNQRYCTTISIADLNELAATLASFEATRLGGAKSRPSRKKEKDDAKQAHSAVGAPKSSVPAVKNVKGLVEALADLLLEALEVNRMTKTGGVDEHEDHA
ncbi:hypothetical protein ACXHXM_33945